VPFTSEQFFDVFGGYNNAIWPAQVVAYALGVLAIGLVFWPSSAGNRIVAGVLALMWAWTGIAYHWLFFAVINPGAFLFGAAFIAQALIFLWAGVVRNRLSFGYENRLRQNVGIALIAYSAIAYPLIGAQLGHIYPRAPSFGVTPCPMTIFTFGLVLLLRTPVTWSIVAIPFLWSLIGGTAAFLLHVPQDWVLLATGILAAILRWPRWQHQDEAGSCR
jgi:hypothetical protein